jgi:large subunit ribosomal protein L24
VKVKIKKGDVVEVISGKEADKGKRGEVIRVYPEDHRVVVQKINMRKKHQRQVQTQGRSISPGIIEYEGSLDISNVMLVCPKCNEPTKVGVQREGKESHRTCKQCGALID